MNNPDWIDKLVVPPKKWSRSDVLYSRSKICPPNITSQSPSVAPVATQTSNGSTSDPTNGVASNTERGLILIPAVCFGVQTVLVYSSLILL